MKKKIVALIGKSGSGKDTILKELVSRYPSTFHKIISTTTRPRREYERNEIDYHFISDIEFHNKVVNNDFLVTSSFKNWSYGILFSELSEEKLNIGVFAPSDIIKIQNTYDIELIVFYVSTLDKIRLLRCLQRETFPDIDEIIRRYLADKEDFKLLQNINYYSVVNDTSDIEEAIQMIYDILYQIYSIICK